MLEFIQDPSTLKEREEYYINIYTSNNPEIGFNHRVFCTTNLGIKRSLESRLKQSRSKKGITPNINYVVVSKLNSKQVTGINKNTNERILFDSIKHAGEILKIQRTSISKVLHKKLKSAGGYYWDFIEQSISNNPVNSVKTCDGNTEPSSSNSIIVDEKVQRLIGEELTNNPNTSAGQPKDGYEVKFDYEMGVKLSIPDYFKLLQEIQ